MHPIFNRIKNINPRHQIIFCGYLRENISFAIPQLIFSTALSYFGDYEYFTKYGHSMFINDNKDTVSMKNASENTVYGNILIDKCLLNTNLLYLWCFKILKLSQKRSIIIGIDSSNKNYSNVRFTDSGKYTVIGYSSSGQFESNYHWIADYLKYKENDIITMIYNTNLNSLEYFVNNNQSGISYKIKFDKNQSYHMALSIYNQNDCVKLIKFEIIYL